MSSRPGIIANGFANADMGRSPNRYAAGVTCEVRIFWPPLATDEEIEKALTMAVENARQKIKEKRSERS